MADGTVGVRQADAADRFIDNEVVLNDVGTTVYRQKVRVGHAIDLSATTLSTLATEATLVNLYRRTDPLPWGSNVIGSVGDRESKAVELGRYRFSGGKATTSAVAPNASLTLTNPAGSTNDVILSRFMVEVDAAADIVYLYGATSTGMVQTNDNPNQRTSLASQAVVRVGSGVLSGGTQLSLARRANTQSPISVGPFEWRIPPGTSWTVRFLGPGATNNVYFNVGWFEVAAGGVLA